MSKLSVMVRIPVLLLVFVGFSGLALAGSSGSAKTGAAENTSRITKTLPPALRPALYQALAKDESPAYTVNKNGCVSLPKQALKACFDGHGAHFTGAAKPLSLHLVAFGRGDTLSPVKAVEPVMKANQVSYAHGNIAEWWWALPIGFEQGFTLAKRPAGQGQLTLALATSRQDASAPEKGALVWGRLHYGDLVVTDAHGKVVPATLKTQGNRILIAVNDAHATYPLTVDPLVWLEQQVVASDGAPNNAFGFSVAIDGSTAVIGAVGASVNGNPGQGAAYVFTESAGIWSQTAKLTASDGAAGDEFGDSVALYGNTAVIGAYDVTVDGNSFQGAAYVFKKSGDTWSQTAKLTASDGAAYAFFGSAVALEDGTIVIGADSAAVNGNFSQGAAYVFTNSGGTWSQAAKLIASDGAANDYFGASVALDGSTAMIGADGATVGGNTSQGAVYVFTESGGTWSQTAKLAASDGATNDWFGNSVALDGNTAVIGARFATIRGTIDQGAAYVFTESGGTWSQIQKLTASDGAEFDQFGWSVALDGSTAVIGADDATVGGTSEQGAAYVFTESGGTWNQTQKLAASDGGAYDAFGYSVALAGNTALIGAYVGTAVSTEGVAYFYGETDLGLNMSALQTVGQGQQYTSQTIATNNASATSPAVIATITVPAAASFISATATQGSCGEASDVVTCFFGQINGNAGTATANVTLKATGSPGTTIHNTSSVALAEPTLTASAPTQITSSQSCPAGYTTYTGTLAENAGVRGPSYEAPAGEENAILYAPAGFRLYARVDNSVWGTQRQQGFLGTEVHRWGPAGTYAWGIKAGDTGGAFTLCIMHP